jgi:nucleotide-binding universal stress UspA family protein
MSYRTVLAVLQGGAADGNCLDAAHAVARPYDGHVDALHVRADPKAFLDYTGDAMTGDAYAQLIDAVEKEVTDKAKKARAAFDGWSQKNGIELVSEPKAGAQVSATWVETTGAEDRVVGRDGMLRDVIVLLGSAGEEDLRGEQTIQRALFESGRPVLIVPHNKTVAAFKRIAIFWNGSKEAVRAVEAAMPLLRHAETVDVMWVEEEVEVDAVQTGLGGYLAWHGVSASDKRFTPDKRFIGEMLMDEAVKANMDLVVMGGYSHSRLREFILGGVTQHMLEESSLPVLTAH